MCSGFHTHMLSMWDCEAHYNLFWIDTSTSNTHKTWLDHKHSYQEYKMQCFFFACHHFQLQPNFYIAWISLAASRLFLYSQFNNLHVTASPDRTARLYFSLFFSSSVQWIVLFIHSNFPAKLMNNHNDAVFGQKLQGCEEFMESGVRNIANSRRDRFKIHSI